MLGESQCAVGAELYPPYIECSTKHQPADEYVSDEAAALLGRIRYDELLSLYHLLIRPASICLKQGFKGAGLRLLDGKFEVGFLPCGSFTIADSMSPDEIRLVDTDRISYDKDPVRLWYEEYCREWVARLMAAKAAYPNDKSMWPEYESVPPQRITAELLRRYEHVAREIGAI